MALTNAEILENASKTYHDLFDSIFENGAPGFYELFSEVISTDSVLNEIDVMETMPQVREWIGEKTFRDIFVSNFTATVKNYEKSMSFKRMTVTGDRTGKVAKRLASFLASGGDGGSIYDLLSTAALVANGLCYDGSALFSASHPRGPAGANQSNITTTALSFGNHDAINIAGSSLRDNESEPMGISYDTLMVGPKNKKMGMQITQSTERVFALNAAGAEATSSVVAAASAPNVFGGGEMALVVNPRLVGTYDDYCYYLDTSKGVRPIVGYEMRAPEPVEQFSMEAEDRFKRDKLNASVECDIVFAPAAWQVAHAIIL